MFSLTVSKIGSEKSITIDSSHRQPLVDHLEASTKRNGFEVVWNEPLKHGDILRDGQIVALWEITWRES
ncbi:hypothetical protein SEA_DELORIS_92 [Mycobacterium phage Deloris]|nr:hypothetical protein SEA_BENGIVUITTON_92 [Mycobacterium phage BengiVuitton]UXE04085.1 hypothetical protein SEA_DELORIS_92 [Mycobacterium phage Deloris]